MSNGHDSSQTPHEPLENELVVDQSRRNLALALFGTLGAGALLQGCASDPGNSESGALDGHPDIAGHSEALDGTTNIRWFDTVASMRAFTVAPNTNYTALVHGYAAPGDGGGGMFVWSTTVAVDDGNPGTALYSGTIVNPLAGSVIDPNPAAGWRRVYSGPIDVAWFGAQGDGVTDDTACLASIFAALSTPTSVVRLSKGKTYRVTGGIVLNQAGLRVTLAGDGSTIKMDKTTAFAAIELLNVTRFEMHGVRFASTKSNTALLDLAVHGTSNSIGDVEIHRCEFDRVAIQINDGTVDRTPLIKSASIHHNVFYGNGAGLLANDTSNLMDLRGIQSIAIENNEIRTNKFSTIGKISGSCTNVVIAGNRLDVEGIGYPVWSCFSDTNRMVIANNVARLSGSWTTFATEKNGDTGSGVSSEPRDIVVANNIVVADVGETSFEMVSFYGSWGLPGATEGLQSSIQIHGNECRGIGLTRSTYIVRGFTEASLDGNHSLSPNLTNFHVGMSIDNCMSSQITNNQVNGTVQVSGHASHPGATYYANSPKLVSIGGNTVLNYGELGAFSITQCTALEQLSIRNNTARSMPPFVAPYVVRLAGVDGASPLNIDTVLCAGNSFKKDTPAPAALFFGTIDAFVMLGIVVVRDNSWASEPMTFPSGASTPIVKRHNAWITNNTVPTTVTFFNGSERGDVFLVQIGDSNTTIDCTGTNLVNASGASDITPGYGDVLRCTNVNGIKIYIERIDL